MSTRAPDFETLYDLETAIEEAGQTILAAAGIEAFIQRETDDLPATRVDIQLRVGKATGHRSQVTPGQFALDAWEGQLGFEIWTPRLPKTLNGEPDGPPNPDYNPKLHGRMRGKVRHTIQYFADRFTEAVLPYHVLTKIQERDTMPSVKVDDDSDLSNIVCDVIISIRTGCWPV